MTVFRQPSPLLAAQLDYSIIEWACMKDELVRCAPYGLSDTCGPIT